MHDPDDGRATTTPTIVYLTSDRAQPVSQSPTRVIEIKRDEGDLSPAFTAAAMRQTLKFRIVDDIHHRIFSESAVGPFDLGSLGKGQSSKVSFDKPGMLRLYCALHPGENAALYISPSDHFAQVPASGEVVLSGLLPGNYALHTWSESAPESVVSVAIHPGSVSSIDIRRPDPGERE
jgi:plastocyanin